MKTYMKLGIISLAASAVLIGCGSSDTNSNDTSLETGYFIDAPVQGLAYQTASGVQSTTDQYGRFNYKKGEKVRFMLGKLDLGEVAPDQEGLVTPATLAGDDETLKVQLLRVLQALDSDNDPSNGITIPQDVVDSLSKLSEEKRIADVKDDTTLLSLDKTLAEKLDEDYDGVIDIDHSQAEQHFDNSLSKWQSGMKPDHDAFSGSQNQGNGNGNGNGQGNGQGGHGTGSGGTFDLSQYPVMQNLTPELKDALAYMGNEERLAYDVYMNLYNYHVENSGDAIRQFQNIASRSEIKHIGIVQDLVRRYNLSATDLTNVENPVKDSSVSPEDMPMGQYDVPAIQELYDTLYAKGIQSRQDALEVGCMVEVTDVDDLDKYIGYAEEANATDILEGFKILREGSYNHYWAFDKGLKNMGVAEGCAVLGDKYAKTKEEYPSSH